MSQNTIGHLFRVTTWGESHGSAIGCIVDGCPPRIPISEAEIQAYLDKRRPGQSRFTTQRREPDAVKILSGVFADEATGGLLTTGAQTMPQVLRTMNAIFSGVQWIAATTRSPSFSRSSSSVTTTISPRAKASMAEVTEL